MLPCVSRYALAATWPDPAIPSRRGDHRARPDPRHPTPDRAKGFRGSGVKTRETPRQRRAAIEAPRVPGRPPVLTPTLPSAPRSVAPQNPSRVVGSGFIQFPPQRPFAGPLLTQPPTVSVRDPRSAKRSASKSRRSLSRQDALRDACGDSHGARRPRVEASRLDINTDERARARALFPSRRGRLTAVPPTSGCRFRRARRSKTITPRSGKTPTNPRRLRLSARPLRSSRGTTDNPPPTVPAVRAAAAPATVPAVRPAAAAAVPAIRPAAAAAVPAVRPAIQSAPRAAAATSRAQPVRRRAGAGTPVGTAAAAAEADGAGEPARDARAEGTEAGAEEPRNSSGDAKARHACAAARRAARAGGARGAETPEGAPRRDRRDAGGGSARGARADGATPRVGDPRRAVRRARLEVSGEAQPEEASRSGFGVTGGRREVVTSAARPSRASGLARAESRRAAIPRTDRGEKKRTRDFGASRVGSGGDAKIEKPENRKTESSRLDGPSEPRGGNFYAFPRALSVEDARVSATRRAASLCRLSGSGRARRKAPSRRGKKISLGTVGT